MAATSPRFFTCTTSLASSGLPSTCSTSAALFGSDSNCLSASSLVTNLTLETRGSAASWSRNVYTLVSGVSSAMLIDISLTLVLKPSSTWENACPTSRFTPARMRMSVIETTAARLTARFRQKLCQALLSANRRFRRIIVISPGSVVSGDLPGVDRHHAAAEKVHDLAVVRGHHDGRTASVDAQEELHDLPRRGGVEVAGRLVGDDHPRGVHERPRDGDALLLAAGQVRRVGQLLAGEAHRVERFGHAAVDQAVRLAVHPQREGHVLVHGQVRQELEVLEDQAHLAAVEGKLPALHAPQLDALDEDLALGRFSSRISRRTMVDFPAPEGPTRNTKSPSGTTRLMSRSASVPVGYRFHTCWKLMTGRVAKSGVRTIG